MCASQPGLYTQRICIAGHAPAGETCLVSKSKATTKKHQADDAKRCACRCSCTSGVSTLHSSGNIADTTWRTGNQDDELLSTQVELVSEISKPRPSETNFCPTKVNHNRLGQEALGMGGSFAPRSRKEGAHAGLGWPILESKPAGGLLLRIESGMPVKTSLDFQRSRNAGFLPTGCVTAILAAEFECRLLAVLPFAVLATLASQVDPSCPAGLNGSDRIGDSSSPLSLEDLK